MLKTDALSQLKQLKQDIKASRNLQQGVVKGTANKFGFVTLDSGKDVFLPADEMAKVLPGDRVEVEVKKEPKNKVFALVERLIDSPTKIFSGKYVTKGKAHFVEPDIAGMSQWLFVPPPKRKGAQSKDYVQCKLTQHPFKHGKPQAAVVEVIGGENEPGIEWRYAMRKHGIAEAWSDEVAAELAGLDERFEAAKNAREDLSSLAFVTIDAASTQDMDDALWVEPSEDGWLLRVAIAEPDALIPPGSKLDAAVLERATSTYFPAKAIAMLPQELSSELASLKPDVDRLAKVVELKLDAGAKVLEQRVFQAVIRSKAKLSYQEASAIIAGEQDSEHQEMLRNLDALTQRLEQWRKENALVHPGREEFVLEIDDKQKLAAIHPKPQTLAHRIVEESMLLVNRSIAAWLASIDVDSIFVAHAGMRADRKESFASVLADQVPELAALELNSLEGFIACSRQLQEHKPELFTLLSRQMEKTRLVARAEPHLGLGLNAYTTFTSPLRKASDFLLHRQVSHFLETGQWAAIEIDFSDLEERLQTSRAAVYELEQWLKCQFMHKRKDSFDATVVRVFASGCQVRINENGVEGFLPVRELEGKFSFNQDLMTLAGDRYRFELDQALRVSIKNIDWKRRQIQFVPDESGV